MSRICHLCGKGPLSASNVPRRGGANHVLARTKRVQRPNLQSATILVDGRPRRMRVCPQCLRARHTN